MSRISRYFEIVEGQDGRERMRVHLEGAALIRLALTNKGTSFPEDERIALGIEGLLPPHVTTLEEQVERTYGAFTREPTPLAKYTYLRGLQERNEILFYALLEKHLAEMLPIIYTPTVGEAVKNASVIYQGARGLSLSPRNIGRAAQVARNCILDDVRIIVATDSSAILGIGDQGWGGLSISIGKLALYTAAGGVSPYHSLPVGLDVGTDRQDLLESASYLGVRQRRLRGAEYMAFMDEFIDAVKARWPQALLQWEDLSKDTAFDVLERYRKTLPSFNDDIQGTGAVALAGLLGACALRGRKLRDEVVVIHGAGAGGAGVAWAIVEGMKREGLSAADAHARVLVIDSKGLLVEGRAMEGYKRQFAQPRARVAAWAPYGRSPSGQAADGASGTPDLLTTIARARGTILLGLSGQASCFTEPMVRALCENVERPVVFPLSNPTSSCEAMPADLLAWSHGRAIVATGSPFEPVHLGGREIPIGQGNNAFVFPGLGFGAILAEASEITDGMVLTGAYALAEYVRERHLGKGLVYPPVEEMREVSRHVATRVIQQAFDDGVARTTQTTRETATTYVRDRGWWPRYLPFEKA
jgi:malate dehydrogenase (oxaloacetate-decarboxylating)